MKRRIFFLTSLGAGDGANLDGLKGRIAIAANLPRQPD